MLPVFGWEVVERQQHIAIFLQALASRLELRTVLFQEVVEGLVSGLSRLGLPDVVNGGLRPWLHALGKVVQYVGRLVNPTSLFSRLGENLPQRSPKPFGALREDLSPL